MAAPSEPPVVLFGYPASTFTLKIQLVLKLKQIPYTYIRVPSMLPRPLLIDTFALTYRKIPVLAIGRELYCDTSLITEALERFFPESEGYGTLYPRTADGIDYRGLVRGFVSHWTDRALFRVTTGLIPATVWRTRFGEDRAGLIGHKLDADKLEAKVPENLARLDTQLSILEPLFEHNSKTWLFPTSSPSLADLSLFYQLSWGTDIAKGKLVSDLSGGGTPDLKQTGADEVFNAQRYPAMYTWYRTLERYLAQLPDVETSDDEWENVVRKITAAPTLGQKSLLLHTPRNAHADLDARCGLTEGAAVSVAPDDTGRANPQLGTLVALSPEEVVITPSPLREPASIVVRMHFPRVGFTIRPHNETANKEVAKL